jgi:hypothetical protein
MNNQVEKQTNKILYTKEQIELIRSQIAPEATQEELKLFLYQFQGRFIVFTAGVKAVKE